MKILPKLRILDFDCEARPLSWYGGDFVTKELTAIAWSFVDSGQVYCALLGPSTTEQMLGHFVTAFNEADMVTGHFIRGYDLPLINGMLAEKNMPLLSDKLSHDTKLDLVKRSGLSNSQENLGAILGLAAPKVGMDQAKWRSANRLETEGIRMTEERVVGDVVQHMEMRKALIERGWLGPPKVWSSKPTNSTRYHA